MRGITVSLPNSLLLIMDPNCGEPPSSMGGAAVAATESCVAVGTLVEHDGSTTIHLLDQPESVVMPNDLKIMWKGEIRTSGEIAVTDIAGVVLLATDTGQTPMVTVCANDANEPNSVWVIVSGGVAP